MKRTEAGSIGAPSIARQGIPQGQSMPSNARRSLGVFCVGVLLLCLPFTSAAAQLLAGVAKVDISRSKPANAAETLYAKALVLQSGETTAVIVAIDAVAIDKIGSIRAPFLANVRAALKADLGIEPANVLVNVSHCHGVVHEDVEARTIQAVREAAKNLLPVKVGAGVGHENRVMENRRIFLKNGREADVRHAYSMPHDNEVAGIGPIDPEIGILRLDKANGDTLALVYNFAMHPIQGTPARGGDTADVIGFASQTIEENLSPGAMAFFIQGCGGDINPVQYKDVNNPRDAEPLGQMLGLSALRAARQIQTGANAPLKVVNETIRVPRADLEERIEAMMNEEEKLIASLRGTTLNFKSFLPLYMKYSVSGDEFPSYYSHRYKHDELLGREDLKKMDERNRADMEKYIRNIRTMEKISILRTNLRLLDKRQQDNQAAGMKPIPVEVVGLRVGDFRLVTFPGEVTVQIGLNLKRKSPHDLTFVAGYSNGYIYYCPTAEQLKNRGGAQEDSDCLVAPEWQAMFEEKALEILKGL